MANKLKAPYPWRGIWRIAWAILVALFMMYSVASTTGRFAHDLFLPPGWTVLCVIVAAILYVDRVFDRVKEHRSLVREAERELEKQSTGTAPLLRPADSSDESLLRATSAVADTPQKALVRPAPEP